MTHEVYAHRVGDEAILKCDVCAEERSLPEGRFEVLNDFIQEHKRCVPLDSAP